MDSAFVTCPHCFEDFEVVTPPSTEVPAEVDYDCEVCCRPMLLRFALDDDEVLASAHGLDE